LPPPTVQASGLSLTFGENDTAIPQGANSALDQVVTRLNSDPALRVRIEAYASGGSAGKSRARRLSLSRALAVRSYLLDKGIATERVDVRALGTPNSGNSDRVDIGWVSG
jgi:outer membrane protein OmpA-like peptidoglycan-associated protein